MTQPTLTELCEQMESLRYKIQHHIQLPEDLMDKTEDIFMQLEEALGEIKYEAEKQDERIVEDQRASLRRYRLQGCV